MSHVPPLPDGYTYALARLQNLLLGMHNTEPVLWLDESLMQWQVLDQHISQVQDALDP